MGGSTIRNPSLSVGLQTTTSEGFFGGLIQALITLGFVAGGIVFLFMLISGGIQWMSAEGDKAKLEQARNRLTHAIVGLVILFSVFAIINVINLFFGIDLTIINFDALKVEGAPSNPLPKCIPRIGAPCPA